MAEAEANGSREELRMLYHLEARAAEGVRRNRWVVLFYGFLVYVLILLAARPLVGEGDVLRLLVVSAFSLIVLVFSIWFLASSKRHLAALSGKLAEIAGQLSQGLRQPALFEEPREYRRDDTPLLIFFAGLLTAGWFITNLLLYRLDPVVIFILLAFSFYIWLVSIIALLSVS